MSGLTLLPPRDIEFTGEPCPRCFALSLGDHVWPEMVMPLPPKEVAPLSLADDTPCCFDCQSADTLFKLGLPGPSKYAELLERRGRAFSQTWFIMGRVAVGNDRLDQERLPGMPMGLVYYGIMAPSKKGDLEKHLAWLEGLGLRLPWTEPDRY